MKYNTNCGIYKITNVVDGKFYIGSSKVLNRRWAAHKWELKYNRHCNKKLQSAYNKYGAESFIYEVIEYVDEKDIVDREQYYIDKLDACNRDVGYNLNPLAKGGGGAVGSNNGWYGKGHLQVGELNPFYGKTHTEETRKKLSLYASENKGSLNPNFGNRGSKNPLSKEVIQIDINTLEIIKTWGSCMDIKRELKYHAGNISAICLSVKNEQVWKKYKGFYWCYSEDLHLLQNMNVFVHSQYKKVVKLDVKDNSLLGIYDTVKEAAKSIGVRSENICRVCKGRYETSGGYKWMYLEEYEKLKSAN